MVRTAGKIGANTFAFFTRNPRGGNAKAIEPADVAQFLEEAARQGVDRLVAHAPYTLNPCAAKEQVLEFAKLVFAEDLQRMEFTPGQYYNFHPGSHVGQGVGSSEGSSPFVLWDWIPAMFGMPVMILRMIWTAC